MDINNLKSAVRNALWDGYVNRFEAHNIQKYALLNDNTVTKDEKVFLQDAYNTGVYMEPYAHHVFQKLITYGDEKITDQMAELRQRKQKEHWFSDEYLKHAVPTLVNSTDNLTDRITELKKVKNEVRMFNSEYRQIAEQVLLNSHDSIAVRMYELKNLKTDASLFNSDFKELGRKLLLSSYDTKTARLMALDKFKVDARLFNSEYQELREAIYNDYHE